ncbi:MAG TPA: helix-turn-helix domain-containing protein [Caulobacterales bacterium]|nr:helix-turn-helix domain-containing protein [Caulobacterales bacterium]
MDDGKFIRTCSIWRALEIVGDTSVLLILEAVWLGERRFDDIRARTGVLQAQLSDRLKRLVAADILEKVPYGESERRFEYRLAKKGLDLYWTSLMMLRWEQRWGSTRSKMRIQLRHKTCGKRFEPTPACLHCREEISAHDVEWREGPGVGWMEPRYSRRRQQRNTAINSSGLMVDIAQITGDRWASLVLRSIFTGLRRFDEIRRDSAIATNILTERLNWLLELGVLSAREIDGRSFEYRLTKKGIDYYPILLMLMKWGDQYYVSPEGPPLLLRHKKHGHALKPGVICSECKAPVERRDVTLADAAERKSARKAS